jgi:hypothetical protein
MVSKLFAMTIPYQKVSGLGFELPIS